MIVFLQGTIEAVGTDEIFLNVNGVGYGIFVQNPQRFELQQRCRLYTYAVYREDNQQLYGFEAVEQRNFFKLLVEKVNGIGPKLALGILTFFSLSELCSIIFDQNADALAKCPGVGKKTGQRLILELQGYLKKLPAIPSVRTTVGGPYKDAVEALVVLGYGRKHAEELVEKIKGMHPVKDASVEGILKKVFRSIKMPR